MTELICSHGGCEKPLTQYVDSAPTMRIVRLPRTHLQRMRPSVRPCVAVCWKLVAVTGNLNANGRVLWNVGHSRFPSLISRKN
jgi:hypothetical protein